MLPLVFAAALLRPAVPATPATTLAITHVTVIDTTGGPARPDMTVVVEGDRIARVAPAASEKVPEGVRTVDGTGKFVIPGLWDMHIHTFFGDWVPGGREVTLPCSSLTASPAFATWEATSSRFSPRAATSPPASWPARG